MITNYFGQFVIKTNQKNSVCYQYVIQLHSGSITLHFAIYVFVDVLTNHVTELVQACKLRDIIQAHSYQFNSLLFPMN